MSLGAFFKRFFQPTRKSENAALADIRVIRPLECPICKYSLEGLPEKHNCPECGFAYEPDMLVFGKPKKANRVAAIVVLSSIAFMLGVMGWGTYSVYKQYGINIAQGIEGVFYLFAPVVVGTIFSFLLSRQNYWVVVRSDGIAWRWPPFAPRYVSWRDIAAIDFDRAAWGLRIRHRSGRQLWRLANRIQWHSGAASTTVLRNLQKRWISYLANEADRSPERDGALVDAGRVGALQTEGRSTVCPTCRHRLSRETDQPVICEYCPAAFRPNALIFRYCDRPIGPSDWGSILVCGCLGAAAYFTARDTLSYSISLSFLFAGVTSLVVGGLIAANHHRPRRARCLVLDDLGIEWEDFGTHQVRTRWDEVAGVVSVAKANGVFLRRADGDIVCVPQEFLPKGFNAVDLAAVIENVRQVTSGRQSATSPSAPESSQSRSE